MLIDADSLVYAVGFTVMERLDKESGLIIPQKPLNIAISRLDQMIGDIIMEVDDTEYTLFLTTKQRLAREDVAVTHQYKGNREAPKPLYYNELREHMVMKWNAVISTNGLEADDEIAIAARSLARDDIYRTIVHIDKDLNQIVGKHYNYNKDVHYEITQDQADRFLWFQVLTGDRTDNIYGIPRCGPVTANKMLDNRGNKLYSECVRDAYLEAGLSTDRYLENYKLIKIG